MLGFAPARIARLDRQVRSALDELRSITSSDSAARDAVTVVGRVADHVAEDWLPLLDRINATTVMRSWTPSGHRLTASATSWHVLDPGSAPFADLDDDELLDLLGRAGRAVSPDPGRPHLVFGAHLDDLAVQLDARLSSPGFGERFHAELVAAPTLAVLVAHERVDPRHQATVLDRLLAGVWQQPGHRWEDIGRAVDTIMASLRHHPAGALEVLSRPDALRTLAEWPGGDPTTTAEFVRAGLGRAVVDDPTARPIASDVLVDLVSLANDLPVDRFGFPDGIARGIAASLPVHLPAFIDTIRHRTGLIHARSASLDGPIDITLGTYEEMTDLLGAVIRRSPEARDRIGGDLALLTRHAITDDDPASAIRIDTVAAYAGLIDDAARNEGVEDDLAAAARQTALLDLTTVGTIGLATAVGVGAGVRGLARTIFEHGAVYLVERRPTPETGEPVGQSDLVRSVHDTVVIESARRLLAATPPGELSGDHDVLGGLVDDLDRLTRAGEHRSADADRLLLDVERQLRLLGGGPALDEILQRPGMYELTTRRSAAD